MGKVEQEKGSLMEAFKSEGGKSKHGVCYFSFYVFVLFILVGFVC